MFHDIAASDEIVCSVRTTFTGIHIKFGGTEAPAKNIEDTPRRHVTAAYGSLARRQKYQSCEEFNTLIMASICTYVTDLIWAPAGTSKRKQIDSTQ